jgi:hypothetical protein
MMLKKILPNLALMLVSILITYSMLEIGFRIFRRMKLPQEYAEYYFQAIDAPIYLLDEKIGYRYKPNAQVFYANFNFDNTILQSNHFNVNNLGHIAPNDDALAKPDVEFRIAILGDSFTASIHNDIPWTHLLEENLNADADLKKSLRVAHFKVINFGMDGTGIAQWEQVAINAVAPYTPDLVIINFITEDIRRKFVWRTSVQPKQSNSNYQLGLMCSSLPATLDNRDCAILKMLVLKRAVFDDQNELSRIKREIYNQEVERIEWLAPYPELVARTFGRLWGWDTRLTPSRREIPYYESDADAIRASASALQNIRAHFPNVLVLHNPDPPETLDRSTPALVARLMREPSGADIVRMVNFLPQAVDETEIKSWFKLPWDPHFSNYGAQVYAQAVYGRVRARLQNAK